MEKKKIVNCVKTGNYLGYYSLKRRVDVSFKEKVLLPCACEYNQLKIVKELAKDVTNVNVAISVAISKNRRRMMDFFHVKKHITFPEMLSVATDLKSWKAASYILQNMIVEGKKKRKRKEVIEKSDDAKIIKRVKKKRKIEIKEKKLEGLTLKGFEATNIMKNLERNIVSGSNEDYQKDGIRYKNVMNAMFCAYELIMLDLGQQKTFLEFLKEIYSKYINIAEPSLYVTMMNTISDINDMLLSNQILLEKDYRDEQRQEFIKNNIWKDKISLLIYQFCDAKKCRSVLNVFYTFFDKPKRDELIEGKKLSNLVELDSQPGQVKQFGEHMAKIISAVYRLMTIHFVDHFSILNETIDDFMSHRSWFYENVNTILNEYFNIDKDIKSYKSFQENKKKISKNIKDKELYKAFEHLMDWDNDLDETNIKDVNSSLKTIHSNMVKKLKGVEKETEDILDYIKEEVIYYKKKIQKERNILKDISIEIKKKPKRLEGKKIYTWTSKLGKLANKLKKTYKNINKNLDDWQIKPIRASLEKLKMDFPSQTKDVFNELFYYTSLIHNIQFENADEVKIDNEITSRLPIYVLWKFLMTKFEKNKKILLFQVTKYHEKKNPIYLIHALLYVINYHFVKDTKLNFKLSKDIIFEKEFDHMRIMIYLFYNTLIDTDEESLLIVPLIELMTYVNVDWIEKFREKISKIVNLEPMTKKNLFNIDLDKNIKDLFEDIDDLGKNLEETVEQVVYDYKKYFDDIYDYKWQANMYYRILEQFIPDKSEIIWIEKMKWMNLKRDLYFSDAIRQKTIKMDLVEIQKIEKIEAYEKYNKLNISMGAEKYQEALNLLKQDIEKDIANKRFIFRKKLKQKKALAESSKKNERSLRTVTKKQDIKIKEKEGPKKYDAVIIKDDIQRIILSEIAKMELEKLSIKTLQNEIDKVEKFVSGEEILTEEDKKLIKEGIKKSKKIIEDGENKITELTDKGIELKKKLNREKDKDTQEGFKLDIEENKIKITNLKQNIKGSKEDLKNNLTKKKENKSEFLFQKEDLEFMKKDVEKEPPLDTLFDKHFIDYVIDFTKEYYLEGFGKVYRIYEKILNKHLEKISVTFKEADKDVFKELEDLLETYNRKEWEKQRELYIEKHRRKINKEKQKEVSRLNTLIEEGGKSKEKMEKLKKKLKLAKKERNKEKAYTQYVFSYNTVYDNELEWILSKQLVHVNLEFVTLLEEMEIKKNKEKVIELQTELNNMKETKKVFEELIKNKEFEKYPRIYYEYLRPAVVNWALSLDPQQTKSAEFEEEDVQQFLDQFILTKDSEKYKKYLESLFQLVDIENLRKQFSEEEEDEEEDYRKDEEEEREQEVKTSQDDSIAIYNFNEEEDDEDILENVVDFDKVSPKDLDDLIIPIEEKEVIKEDLLKDEVEMSEKEEFNKEDIDYNVNELEDTRKKLLKNIESSEQKLTKVEREIVYGKFIIHELENLILTINLKLRTF